MKLLVTTALLALAAPLAAAAQTVPAPIAAALADAGRPQADKDRDAVRHPGAILAFAGIKQGDKVGDFFMGGGYWTRILAKAVGPKGHVYGFQPSEFSRQPTPDAALAAAYGNVTLTQTPAAEFAFPGRLDAILTFENWHDLHLARFAAAPNAPGLSKAAAAKLFAALKPGGVLLVADHVANADPAMAAPDALHRIDPALARKEIEAAGFRFEGALPVLRNPADPHTAKVFDPAIRGHTDQFVFKFRKPR